VGRKAAEIDFNIVDTALFYGATLDQLRFLLARKGIDVSVKTIQRIIEREKDMTFGEYKSYNHGGAKFKLAQKQFEVAMSGNPSMLIWLGKQLLGQSDKNDLSIDASKIEIKIDIDDERL